MASYAVNDAHAQRAVVDWRAAGAGHSFILAHNAAPVGEVRPLRRRRVADRAVVAEIFRGAPAIDRQRLVEDLDAAVDQDMEPRDAGLLDTSVVIDLGHLDEGRLPQRIRRRSRRAGRPRSTGR